MTQNTYGHIKGSEISVLNMPAQQIIHHLTYTLAFEIFYRIPMNILQDPNIFKMCLSVYTMLVWKSINKNASAHGKLGLQEGSKQYFRAGLCL